MNDDALAVEAVKAGDKERYGELVRRHERMVYAIAWSRLGQTGLCEEAAQDAFVHGFRFLAALRQPEKYAAWIAKIARNIASTLARKRRTEIENKRRWLLDSQASTLGSLVSPQNARQDETLADVLKETLEKLPENHRECLVLHYLQERSARECAEALGVSEETFRVRLHRARNALRQDMQDRMEQALRRLSPRKPLKESVLSAAPAMPLACGATGLGAVVAGLAKTLLPYAPFLLILVWMNHLGHQIIRNHRDPNDWRVAVRRRQGPALIAAFAIFWALMAVFAKRFGFQATCIVLTLPLIPATLVNLLQLRVNRTRSSWTGVLMLAGLWMWFLPITAGGRYAAVSVVGMSVVMVTALLGRKSQSGRLDHNLGLRAAFNELGRAAAPPPIGRAATKKDMLRFARFLGGLSLVTRCSIRGDACHMAASPAVFKGRDWLCFWEWFTQSSTLAVRSDGSCGVTLSDRDWNDIRALNPPAATTRADLEARTTEALSQAWALFLAGDEAGAKAVLQPRSDEDILIRPCHELRVPRIIRIIAITSFVAVVVGLLLLAASKRFVF